MTPKQKSSLCFFTDAPARRRITWSSNGRSEKWGIRLAHSTKV